MYLRINTESDPQQYIRSSIIQRFVRRDIYVNNIYYTIRFYQERSKLSNCVNICF